MLFVVVMALQKGGPYDAPLGHNLRKAGVVLTLVVLNFASRFGAQLVTALVASEDTGNTLKMILTRSLRRSQILAGETLASFTYALALLAALVRAVWVTAIFIAVPLAAVFWPFLRRDVAGE